MNNQELEHIPNYKQSKSKQSFYDRHQHLTSEELLRETLYMQKKCYNIMERNRSNTSKLVWWLVALPIIFGIFFFVLTMISAGSVLSAF